MKIKIILSISFALLCSCNEDKYDLENIVPKEYNKILYINNSGKQEVTLYNTNEDNVYSLSVFKAGSDPTLSASVNINVLTDDELYNRYSSPEGINYKIINSNSYSLEATHIDFMSADRYKNIQISLNPQKVKASMESDPTATWVLPLHVTSDTDSINAEKNELLLCIKDVIIPTLGFLHSTVDLKSYDYHSISTITENVPISLDTENKWDIECLLEPDLEFIGEYNMANNSLYRSLPAGTYSFSESMNFPLGTKNVELKVTINADNLEPGDYMLPIRIKSVSMFEVSSTHAIYPLAIRIMGSKLDRTGWTAEASTEEPREAGGGMAKNAIDDNPATYWHSQWRGASPFPYKLIVDTNQDHTFTQIGLTQRGNGYTDTKAGKFYVSSNKEQWTEVGRFTMQQTSEIQIFGITPTQGRYFKIEMESSYRDTNCSLSEVYAYGLN